MQLAALQGDGAPLRTHLERLHRNTGKVHPLLAEGRRHVPPAVAALWQTFRTLSATRAPAGANGALAAITCGDIAAWERVHRVRLTVWEVETILEADSALRAAAVTPVQPEE